MEIELLFPPPILIIVFENIWKIFKYFSFFNENVEVISYEETQRFFFNSGHIWNTEIYSSSDKIFSQTLLKTFWLNSSLLHTFHKWQKWGKINQNIGVYCWWNGSTFAQYFIRLVKILLTLLFQSHVIVRCCYRTKNIYFIGVSLHRGVNLVHFKCAHFDQYETYMMKLTHCAWRTWDCLLEHTTFT